MSRLTEDTALISEAIAYVIELYRELTEENGAPSLGTQNQVVDFILADPDLSRAVSEWGARVRVSEATTAPPQRLPGGRAYERIAAFMRSTMEQPVFTRKKQGRTQTI